MTKKTHPPIPPATAAKGGKTANGPNMTVFEPLRKVLSEHTYFDYNLYDIIADFAVVQPQVAYAMASHARDITQFEADDDMTYTDLVTEVYWRTFYDVEKSKQYGTDYYSGNPVMLQQLTEFMIDGFNMDKTQRAAHQFAPGSNSKPN
jgi:hypothetical protein